MNSITKGDGQAMLHIRSPNKKVVAVRQTGKA